MMADGIAEAAPEKIARDFSTTNVQIQAVDEADIIKTDGNYIYTVSNNMLFIIKAYPGEDAKKISTTKFKNNPTNLFINGNKLVVFGTEHNPNFIRHIAPQSSTTYLRVYDISNKANPKLEKTYHFEGNFFKARMIDDTVYLLTQSGIYDRPVNPVPLVFEDEAVREISHRDVYVFDMPYNNPRLVSVHALDLNDLDTKTKILTVDGNPDLFMSENNIYITARQYITDWQIRQKINIELLSEHLTDEDKDRIIKINNADEDILSQAEKKAKEERIIQSYYHRLSDEQQREHNDILNDKTQEELAKYEYIEYTSITKMSVDKQNLNFVATNKVPGFINNQFSLDEYEGVLRVATTAQPRIRGKSRWQSRGSTRNNVYTLDENLNHLGELTGLAEGERIFSTRFIKDRLYMVTFRQVDPFFVIDLSNPRNPKEMGQLKIPGFSRYLHPFDDNHIIGIGRDATAEGRQQGLKVSLFDVTDIRNPKETAKFVASGKYTSSIAEWEHKAFLFSKEKELLVIPARSHTGQKFNGGMVFKINEEEIELKGIVDHAENERYYSFSMERSLYIEELLYTKSKNLLRINRIDDLESVNKVALVEEEYRVV
ncbi:MAG: beta-propeller domain-containing protein, partial [Candidatus Nanoarchaeia archaeon]